MVLCRRSGESSRRWAVGAGRVCVTVEPAKRQIVVWGGGSVGLSDSPGGSPLSTGSPLSYLIPPPYALRRLTSPRRVEEGGC